MTSRPLKAPPLELNFEGQPRHVGVEIEFGSVSTAEAASKVHQLFGGDLECEDRHRYHIRNTAYGDFMVELDLQYVHGDVWWSGTDEPGSLKGRLRDLLGEISELIVPNEVVCPPIEIGRLGELERLLECLVDIGARGSTANPLYAFGCQLNPEIASRDPGYILSVLRAYMLLSAWLRSVIELDLSRRLTNFADPFPRTYVDMILSPGYAPDTDQLIDDYIEYNPTRNRELDMLPLFAWLDEHRVRTRVPDTLIKARPTFHYRLPDARIGQQGWSLTLEWNRWCVVEQLAANGNKLRDMSEAFLENESRFLSSNWAIRASDWLLT